MTRRRLFLPALGLALAVCLAACSAAPDVPSSAPPAAPDAAEEETATCQGTLNTLDTDLDYLVIVDGNGDHLSFDLAGADAGGLEPGDAVTVTYTGTLSAGGGEPTATVVSIGAAG